MICAAIAANRPCSGRQTQVAGSAAVRTLILEYVDNHGASHIREMHIEILQRKPGTPEAHGPGKAVGGGF